MRASALLAAALVLSACGDPQAGTEARAAADSTSGLPPLFAERLARVGGTVEALDRQGDVWSVARVRSDSGAFVVTWADLRGVLVEQTMGAAFDSTGPGFYHPSVQSHVFRTVAPQTVVAQLRGANGDGEALAVINGAFFESPGAGVTQIAFPVSQSGRVVTGGSSPYGPGRPDAAGMRWDAPLRVLGVRDTLAHVADYDASTGAPLGTGPFRDALASYAPTAHPTRIATRFHVAGALDADGDGTTETLLVVTSDGRTTNAAPIDVANRLGVDAAHQISLDGGASVFVWTRRTEALERNAYDLPLPHFLTFRLRP